MHEPLKAVFTSDRVVVGVILRSVERYNLTSENQTDRVGSRTLIVRLRSSENYIVGVVSGSGRINQ